MGILKKIAIFSLVFPFLSLALSLCCLKMMPAGAHDMSDCCSNMSMPCSNNTQHGLNSHGLANIPPHCSNCHCEQIAESYDKAALKSVDSHKLTFNNPKTITFASQIFTHRALAPPFFNYHSPPKVVQNSLPLYLQLSVLRI